VLTVKKLLKLEKSPCVDFLVFSIIKLSLDKGREIMKKILAVSLGALLVASAANAETTNTGIASVSYVTSQLAGKQNTIFDLATIRSGAALGATAVQNLGNLGVTATATELNYVDGVTSNIQTQLDSKQASLGYTAENAANKVTSVSSSSTDTQYPSAKAMYTALAGKQASLGYTAENAANKTQVIDANSTATQYPSAKAMYTELSKKQNASQIGSVTAAAMGTTATTVVTAIKEVAGEAADAQRTANTASTNATTANDAIAAMDLATVGGTTSVIRSVAQTNGKVTATAEAVDTAPTGGSAKLITSGGVYSGLEEKVDKKQGSENAGKGLIVEGTNGTLILADIATQEELDAVASTAASGQTAAQVNTAITNAIGGLDVASVGGAGQFVITIKQENGKIDAGVKSFVDTLSDGVLDAPTTNAVYDALQGKLSTTGTAARATADASGNTFTTTYATKTELNGKLGTSLGSSAASKAVITNSSGGITSGTIATGMITDGAVTSDKIAGNAVTGAKIANSTITNDDISANAAIAQSKISGLTTALNGKQDAAPRDQTGNSYFVATSDGVWKDMFSAMPRDIACDEAGVKCALTHKSGVYAWEIVRE